MSLAGFKAANHPQQTANRGRNHVDDRGTDIAFFSSIAERFGGFTLDVAAAAHNAKCEEFFSIEVDGKSLPWRGNVWCNPPYSDCGSWVRKAWEEWNAGSVDLIVMLLPANRAEQGWWQDSVEPFRDRPGSALRTEFIRGRIRFDRFDGWVPGPKGDRPPFGCVLLIWQRNKRDAAASEGNEA